MKKLMLTLLYVLFSSNIYAQNPLANLANSMQPGTWAPLVTNNINGVLLNSGGISGVRTHYSNTAAWDSTRLKLHYLGGDHNESTMQYATYDATTNSWSRITSPYGGHGYDHTVVDSITGTIYYREYGLYPGGNRVFKYPVGGPWSQATTILPPSYFQVAIGTTWWPGSITGGGSDGTYIVYNSGEPNGEIMLFNPATGLWFKDIKGFGGAGTYHSIIEYNNNCNCAILGGGNYNPRKIWRLNADTTVTIMPDAPLDFGIQRANVVADPSNGNFLFLGGGQFYEYNPLNLGTWISKPLPPSIVGNPGQPLTEAVISFAIPNYSVIAYITCRAAGCNMYLYKNGNILPPPPNQPPIVNAGQNQLVQGTLVFLAVFNLSGSAIDDPTQTLTYQWTKLSGPGLATITAPSSLLTSVTVNMAGVYTFRLTVDDGISISTSDVTITVN